MIPVIIIGAGPTGLTAATLLGQYGVECLVLDRWESIYPQPRAVHLDDEIYRLLARLGVGPEFAGISRPCLGLRLVDAHHRVLAEFARSDGVGRHGFPEANMFDQPDLEAILRTNLARYPTVTVRGNTEVTALSQRDDRVSATVTDRATDMSETLSAAYVLGCDGANSLTRAAIRATMRDLNFTQRWLVVDVATDADLRQWEGVHQVCDTTRAATYMRIGPRRYRWEFQLASGETAADYRDPARLAPLLAPWTGDLPTRQWDIVRAAEYTFRAQVADTWRDRRMFLVGDAAHLSPPFIGQGMSAGLRDAANLAWKLAAVLAGVLAESVLDTYQLEREPHARSMIRLAQLIGAAMTAGGRVGDLLRGTLAPRLHRIPGFAEQILSSASPPLRRSPLVRAPRLRRGLVGRLVPNATLAAGGRFDDVAAGRFALVTAGNPTPAALEWLQRHHGVVLTVDRRSPLGEWLRRGHARSALVRPDGTVLSATRSPSTSRVRIPTGDGMKP